MVLRLPVMALSVLALPGHLSRRERRAPAPPVGELSPKVTERVAARPREPALPLPEKSKGLLQRKLQQTLLGIRPSPAGMGG